MASPLSSLRTRAQYGARQLPRIAWYMGHGIAMNRLRQRAETINPSDKREVKGTDAPFPDQRRLLRDMGILFNRDLKNIQAGIYPMPYDRDGTPLTLLRRSQLFFEDLPTVHRRRVDNVHSEVLTEESRDKRPRYYLQNFHFQTDGWLSDDSAERYDTQVEVLFNGTANAMRRQLLVPLYDVLAGRDQRHLRLLDVACGTGRFLDFVKQAYPRLPVTALDMSDAYIRAAKHHLRRRSWVDAVVAKGEEMPFADESYHAVTSIYLFHELPPKIRRAVFAEFARVLKPGGRLVVMDSLQRGDVANYDGMLEMFPQNFHEPYYLSYLDEDFGEIAADVGLKMSAGDAHFISKAMVFDKPA